MKQFTTEELKEIEKNLISLKSMFMEENEKKIIAIENWQKYSELYFEYLGKDNDWRYCLKRGFHLWWVNIKIDTTVFFARIPLRG